MNVAKGLTRLYYLVWIIWAVLCAIRVVFGRSFSGEPEVGLRIFALLFGAIFIPWVVLAAIRWIARGFLDKRANTVAEAGPTPRDSIQRK